MTRVFLDDIRHPRDEYDSYITGFYFDETFVENGKWVIVRNSKEFYDLIPTLDEFIVSFDHDLGEETTGFDCLKWMLANNYIPVGCLFHTGNIIMEKNMRSYWESFKKSQI